MISSLVKAKRRKKARKHNTPRDYFTKEVDIYIMKFIRARSDDKKNEIFEKHIKKSFTALVSNLIFVYKASNLDSISCLRDDCVRYLYTKIDTYDPNKASKAFSYFNVVARNWFFQKYNSDKRDEKKFLTIDDSQVSSSLINKSKEDFLNSHYDFFDRRFVDYVCENLEEFKNQLKPEEQRVLECILALLKNPDSIDVFNKKAVFLYLRNMSELNAKQIAVAIGKLKVVYFKLKKEWIEE